MYVIIKCCQIELTNPTMYWCRRQQLYTICFSFPHSVFTPSFLLLFFLPFMLILPLEASAVRCVPHFRLQVVFAGVNNYGDAWSASIMLMEFAKQRLDVGRFLPARPAPRVAAPTCLYCLRRPCAAATRISISPNDLLTK